MRKLLLGVVISLLTIMAMPLTTFASPTLYPHADKTVVSGTITFNGSPVYHAKVVVTCDTKTQTTLTNHAGKYYVTMEHCGDGNTITVVATKNGETGTATGVSSEGKCNVDVAVINVSMVPEVGIFTGTIAAMTGAGAFLVVRKRTLQS